MSQKSHFFLERIIIPNTHLKSYIIMISYNYIIIPVNPEINIAWHSWLCRGVNAFEITLSHA